MEVHPTPYMECLKTMFSIGIGSKTSTGGVVIEGNEGLLFDGLVASSVGHKATCLVCTKGIGEIVAVGVRTLQLPAGPAARVGDYVACGCPPGFNTLAGHGTISVGSDGAGSSGSAGLNRNVIDAFFTPRSNKLPEQPLESTRHSSSELQATASGRTIHQIPADNSRSDANLNPDGSVDSEEKGEWIRAGEVIGEGRKGIFRLGHKIKIEGADDRASPHVNNSAYELTFTEVAPDGTLLPGTYPTYKGLLSSGLSNAFSTNRVVELHGPPGTKFDWTLVITRTPQSCDNCGSPMIIVYDWKAK